MTVTHQDFDLFREGQMRICDGRYISWIWSVTLVASLIVVISTAAWAGSRQIGRIEDKALENERSIAKIEKILDKKLDDVLRAVEDLNRDLNKDHR